MDLAAFQVYLRARLNGPLPRGFDAELSRTLGVTRAVVSQWRAGVRTIPVSRVEEVARALDLDVKVMVVDADGRPFTPDGRAPTA